MATGKALVEEPYAGDPHVAPSQCYSGTGRFDEGEVVPTATSRRCCKHGKIPAAMLALAMAVAAASAEAATYEISAPGGVGDVTALTNAFAEVGKSDTTGAQILLSPGVYDLRGTQIGSGGAHWRLDKKMKNGLIAGTGATPGDTILLGGGETDKKRIFHIWSTDASKPTTISNLTITGGYTTSDGGGIYGSTTNYGGNLILSHVIISNNYAKGSNGAGGGGVIHVKAYDCLFADNTCGNQHGGGLLTSADKHGAWNCVFSNNVVLTTSKYGAGYYCTGGGQCVGCKFYGNIGTSGIGAYMSGSGLVSNCVFRGNCPTNAANSNKLGGGLYLSSGECVDCKFFGNAADSGGGVYVASRSAVVRNCLFEGNAQTGWASGAALFVKASSPLALVSNCVFNANVAAKESSRTIISNAELVDCVITNHAVSQGHVVAGCNMTRCLFAYNQSNGNGLHVDVCTVYGTTPVSRTNANCVVAFNKSMGVNSITEGKQIVNCTYYGNYCDSGNYGATIRNCVAWNTLIVGNTTSSIGAMDVRRNFHQGEVHELYLTNCIFSASDIAVDADYLCNCKKVSPFKFRATSDGGEFDFRYSSPAFGAGVWEAWMAESVGARDFAGRPRVKFGAIDVGALECQNVPGFGISLR